MFHNGLEDCLVDTAGLTLPLHRQFHIHLDRMDSLDWIKIKMPKALTVTLSRHCLRQFLYRTVRLPTTLRSTYLIATIFPVDVGRAELRHSLLD